MRAFVFPGQGSQSVGMGSNWLDRAPVRRAFELADEALSEPLSRLIADGPLEDLTQTRNTQPALVTVSVAYAWLLLEEGYSFDAVAGHSLGEYSALVVAGSLDFQDAIRLTRLRGELMQTATPLGTGTMAAIMGIKDEQAILDLCAAAAEDQVLEPAAFNSPGQVVVAGHVDAVRRACERAKEFGAFGAKELTVSAPFHCSLLSAAGQGLERALAEVEVKSPTVPYAPNTLGRVLQQASPDDIRAHLVRQVSEPVRWQQGVGSMVQDLGVKTFWEVGPGRVLTGLIKRTDRSLEIQNFDSGKLLTD